MINWEIKNNISWLSEMPRHWSVVRIKHLFQISKEKNEGLALDVLSLTQRGVVLRDVSNNEGQIASSYENYTRVRPGDFVFNPMDLITGFVDCSKHDGVISLAYTVLRPLKNENISNDFYTYYFQWHYLQEILFPFGQGVSPDHRWTLKDRILLNLPLVFPPHDEQVRIAKDIKQKLSVVDELSGTLPKDILRECMSSIIYTALIKG
ncbi:MAG: hypothetical protein RIQ62_1583 [Bacteroidota bacterium]|jgi:type I restriction enzyme S subunit